MLRRWHDSVSGVLQLHAGDLLTLEYVQRLYISLLGGTSGRGMHESEDMQEDAVIPWLSSIAYYASSDVHRPVINIIIIIIIIFWPCSSWLSVW